jgi:hypothetical protein
MIEVYDLRDIGQCRECWLVKRMVEAGSTVQEKERWLHPHSGAVWNKACALDVEEKTGAVHFDKHLLAPRERRIRLSPSIR